MSFQVAAVRELQTSAAHFYPRSKEGHHMGTFNTFWCVANFCAILEDKWHIRWLEKLNRCPWNMFFCFVFFIWRAGQYNVENKKKKWTQQKRRDKNSVLRYLGQ